MVLPATATLAYTLKQQGGAAFNNMEIPFAEVPVPQDVIEVLGARLFSDAVDVSGPPLLVRTVVLKLKAVTGATLVSEFTGDGVQLTGVTISAPGSGYVVPPQLQVIPAITPAILRAYMNVQDATIVNGGGSYSAPVIYFQGGLEIPQVDAQGLLLKSGESVQGCVQGLTLVNAGRGYSGAAVVQFLCNLAPGGRAPAASLSLDANGSISGVLLTDSGVGLLSVPEIVVYDTGSPPGKGATIVPQMGVGTAATGTVGIHLRAINAVSITAAGGPYVTMPKILVVDTHGSGAILIPLMGIGEVDVDSGGVYDPGTHHLVQITELFNQMFANSPAAPFFNLMTVALEQAVASPVSAAAPVIT
jgi:hypothetical protein